MGSTRANWIVAVCAVLLVVAAVMLPVEMLEVLGAPLVIGAAYFGGRRGGILVALWATLVATVAFLTFGQGDVQDYLVTVIGYLVIGVSVGIAVDRFTSQRDRLQDALENADLARSQFAASEARYRLLFESSSDAVYLHGLDAAGEPTRFLSVNDAACARLGYTRAELLALRPRAIDAAPKPGQLRSMMAALMKEGTVLYESVRRTRDGQLVPVEISSSLTEVGGELLVLSISRDISERKLAERRLEELTLHDDLTGLLNRRGLGVMLPEHMKRARRSGHPTIVLYGDLDGFKVLNDLYGHARGDDVLMAVGDALRSAFRESDLVARVGGDEFCVIAETDADFDPSMLGARVDASIEAAGKVLGLPVVLSHGEVVTDWHGLEDHAAILARADANMYEVKRARAAGDSP